jgi:CheY-like chemotaxis protein
MILLSQDNPLIALIQHLLKLELPMEMMTFSTLKSAGQRLIQPPVPHLLIMDLAFKDGDHDPLNLLRQLRARPQFAAMPILVLTAEPDPLQIRAALQAGANRYLTKIFIRNNLIDTIEALITPVR